MRRLILLVSAFLTAQASLHAQAQLDPAAQLLTRQAQGSQAPMRGPLASDGHVSVYVVYDAAELDLSALASVDATLVTCADGLATVRLPLQQLSALAQLPGIRYVQAPAAVTQQLDLARVDTRADLAQHVACDEQGGTYTGRGVVIGLVDAGLDYCHNAFRQADGTLRISRVWEQASTLTDVPSPEGFGYGAEFTTPEAILAAGGDSEAGSHGTHVAGIAAGSDTWLDGQYHGLAPEAELVMVAISDVGADNVRVSDAIQYIYNYADQVGKPCVINLSLGTHSGPHDGTSPFDQLADRIQGPGRLIVGAAGNYGADHFHLSVGDHGASASVPLQTLLNFKRVPSVVTTGGWVEVWADAGQPLTVELFAYSLFSKKESDVFTFQMPADGVTDVQTISLGRYITGTMQLAAELNPLNGKQHIVLTSQLTGIRTNYAVGLRVLADQADVWADNSYIDFNAAPLEGFVNPTTESTVTEIGGTARRILSVGAYTTRDEYRLEGNDKVLPVGEKLHDRCSFSGYGPTADGRLKPDVCAPGSFIISSYSGFDLSSQQYLASSYVDAAGHKQPYGYLQGTSMSTPFVTGVVALLLQAYPNLTPEQLHEAIAATSRQDDFTADPRYWGHGKVDVLSALNHCIQLRKEADGIRQVSGGFEGMIRREGDMLHVWMPRPATDGSVLALYDAAGNVVRRYGLASGVDVQQISVAGLSSGVYMLRTTNFSLKLAL